MGKPVSVPACRLLTVLRALRFSAELRVSLRNNLRKGKLRRRFGYGAMADEV